MKRGRWTTCDLCGNFTNRTKVLTVARVCCARQCSCGHCPDHVQHLGGEFERRRKHEPSFT